MLAGTSLVAGAFLSIVYSIGKNHGHEISAFDIAFTISIITFSISALFAAVSLNRMERENIALVKEKKKLEQ